MQQNDFPLKASKQGIRGGSTIETCEKSEGWSHQVNCDQLYFNFNFNWQDIKWILIFWDNYTKLTSPDTP